MTDSKQAKGGRARAEVLSKGERTEIARRAADSRWGIMQATHTGDLHLGNVTIPCAVLEDGTRVLSETGVTMALLGSRSGASRRRRKATKDGDGPPIPLFLASAPLAPFIDNDLHDGPLRPITYRINDRKVTGYSAELLPAVCDIWLRARDAGALQPQQLDRAKKAEIVMRALARIGIIALVDEATGYEDIRDRLALQALLDQYLLQEFASWAKRFPDEFYKEIFRLRRWEWRGMKVNRPPLVGRLTNDVVYARIAPGILKELQERNPKDQRGYRRAAHHQWLTEDVGHPALAQHLHAVIALMRASEDWEQFKHLLNKALPKRTRLDDLPLFSALPQPS